MKRVEYQIKREENSYIGFISLKKCDFKSFFGENVVVNYPYEELVGKIEKVLNIPCVKKDNQLVLILREEDDSLMRKALELVREFYENYQFHVTRMFGSYILLKGNQEKLEAIKATKVPIQYCPLMEKLLKEVGGNLANELLRAVREEDGQKQEKMMCELINKTVIESGYFDTSRPLNSCEANVTFGASETIYSAFEGGLLDAAVIVSNNLGTIITTNAPSTQGAVKRMTGLFYTSPSKELVETAYQEGIIPVFPYKAEIDQLEGVKEAIRLGYQKIAVSVAQDENYLHEQFHNLEKEYGVTIYKFGLCSTGIKEETAKKMVDYADIVWSCASKYVKELVEPQAIAQVGIKIGVHILTNQGWTLVKNHLEKLDPDTSFENTWLTTGEDKPIFATSHGKIKKLKKKELRGCIDCPHPCI